MSKYIGRLVNVGIAKEATRGTAVAAAFWVPKSSVAFFDRSLKEISRLNYGTIGDGNTSNKLLEWAEGTIESDVLDKPFGLFLLAAFGTLNTSGPSDSAYTHTFSLQNDNQHDSLTITLDDPDRTDQYAFAMLDSLEMEIIPDDVVKFVAAFKSRPGRAIAAASESYIANNKFLGRHASVKIAAATGNLAAASAINIKSLKLRIAKNTLMNNVLGTVHPDDILNGKFEITGEITLDLEDQTYRQYMLDGSYKAMRINLTNSDVLIGATSRPSFTLDLSRVAFDAWEPTRNNDELVMQKINFRALYDITNGNIVNSCTLVNGQSSY